MNHIYTIITRDEQSAVAFGDPELGYARDYYYPYAAVVAENRNKARVAFVKEYDLEFTTPLIIRDRGESDLAPGIYYQWIWNDDQGRMIDITTLPPFDGEFWRMTEAQS